MDIESQEAWEGLRERERKEIETSRTERDGGSERVRDREREQIEKVKEKGRD